MCVGSLGCLLRRQWGKFLANQTGDSAYVCFVRPIWVRYLGSCGWISYPLSLESLVPEYSAFGVIREPAGSALPGIAPTNAYRCTDGVVLIAGNGNSIFKLLMQAIGREDLGNNPALAENVGRVARVDELDRAIEAWTCERAVAEVL